MTTKTRTPPPGPEDLWRRDPDTIWRFLNERPHYEELCTEAGYILRKRLEVAEIDVSSVTWRAKTLKSFIEKIPRKGYARPLEEITDRAGVRVVCLYPVDLPRVEEIVREEFDVIEREDKKEAKGVDQFGYLGLHFLVRLGKRSSGARYDDLKDLICEIQVRTVCQDAWSILQHHMVYKRESDVPREIQRKVNGLAAVLETADEFFDLIRGERVAYVTEARAAQSKPGVFLQYDLNLDSLREYLAWKFPEVAPEHTPGQVQAILADLDRTQYTSLSDVDDVVNATELERSKIRTEAPASMLDEDGNIPGAVELLVAVALHDPKIRHSRKMPESWQRILEKYKKAAPK